MACWRRFYLRVAYGAGRGFVSVMFVIVSQRWTDLFVCLHGAKRDWLPSSAKVSYLYACATLNFSVNLWRRFVAFIMVLVSILSYTLMVVTDSDRRRPVW